MQTTRDANDRVNCLKEITRVHILFYWLRKQQHLWQDEAISVAQIDNTGLSTRKQAFVSQELLDKLGLYYARFSGSFRSLVIFVWVSKRSVREFVSRDKMLPGKWNATEIQKKKWKWEQNLGESALVFVYNTNYLIGSFVEEMKLLFPVVSLEWAHVNRRRLNAVQLSFLCLPINKPSVCWWPFTFPGTFNTYNLIFLCYHKSVYKQLLLQVWIIINSITKVSTTALLKWTQLR